MRTQRSQSSGSCVCNTHRRSRLPRLFCVVSQACVLATAEMPKCFHTSKVFLNDTNEGNLRLSSRGVLAVWQTRTLSDVVLFVIAMCGAQTRAAGRSPQEKVTQGSGWSRTGPEPVMWGALHSYLDTRLLREHEPWAAAAPRRGNSHGAHPAAHGSSNTQAKALHSRECQVHRHTAERPRRKGSVSQQLWAPRRRWGMERRRGLQPGVT